MVTQEYVAKQFNSVQEYYKQQAEAGLWKSEEAVIDHYFTGDTVLDLGCGTGRTSFPLAKKGYEVTGVDISTKMIENAQTIANDSDNPTFKQGDARNLKFEENSFDNVLFSTQGLMQIPGSEARLAALKAIARVLKTDGIFLFTTHVRELQGWLWFWTKHWIKLYVAKPIGFDVKEQEYGDRFFTETTGDLTYSKPQYIHIPSPEEIKKQLKQTSLRLLHGERANDIAGQRDGNPMFWVCTK